MRSRQLTFGACALHSSQSATSAVGQKARRLAVEWAWGVSRDKQERTHRRRSRDGGVQNPDSLPGVCTGGGDREEWHPGDHAPFLGKEEFVKKVAVPKRQHGATRPAKLEVLLKAKAREAGLEPQAVARRRKSRTIGEVRRSFIKAAVLEQGYQASEVASFLGCHAANVSRALQKRGSKI